MKGYIAVEEVEKLIHEFGARQAHVLTIEAKQIGDCIDGLLRLVASAKEGVTIDKFQVLVEEFADHDDKISAMLLDDPERDLLKPYNFNSGTLVFIPEGQAQGEKG